MKDVHFKNQFKKMFSIFKSKKKEVLKTETEQEIDDN